MIKSWIVLIWAIILIKTKNIDQLQLLLKKRKEDCIDNWSINEAHNAYYSIQKSKSFFLSRIACLEQSVALFLYATSQKKLVDLCFGVRLSPFVSHAWIEIDGEPFLEEEQIKNYKKMVVI